MDRPDTFVLTLRYYETPFSDTYAFQFDGDSLLLKGDVKWSSPPMHTRR